MASASWALSLFIYWGCLRSCHDLHFSGTLILHSFHSKYIHFNSHCCFPCTLLRRIIPNHVTLFSGPQSGLLYLSGTILSVGCLHNVCCFLTYRNSAHLTPTVPSPNFPLNSPGQGFNLLGSSYSVLEFSLLWFMLQPDLSPPHCGSWFFKPSF